MTEEITDYDFCSLDDWKKKQKKIQDDAEDVGSFDFETQ